MRHWIDILEGRTVRFTVLYHCSPRTNLASIQTHGLDPAKSQWSSAVYLAGDEPHAWGYAKHHGQTDSVMLAITVAALDASKLGPDDVDLPDMLNDPDDWQDYDWQASLRICGQCCYSGTIPPSAISYRDNDNWIPLA